MNNSYQKTHFHQFASTPYKQVISQYVTPKTKPIDINPNYKVFPQTYNIQQNTSTYEYKPKVIMSGYIVGQPIAFSQTPNLPEEYARFSPSKQNIRKPVFIQTANSLPNSFNLSASMFRNQQNTILRQNVNHTEIINKNRSRILSSVPTGSQQTSIIKREDYDKLFTQNILLRTENARLLEQNRKINLQSGILLTKDNKISQLQKQVYSLKQQLLSNTLQKGMITSVSSNFSQSEKKQNCISQAKIQQVEQILNVCISKYRQSMLQQQKLLIDRFRLQCKNEELEIKKQKLMESRKQQTQRKSSLYQKTQHKICSPSKQNFQIAFRHQQKHWRK